MIEYDPVIIVEISGNEKREYIFKSPYEILYLLQNNIILSDEVIDLFSSVSNTSKPNIDTKYYNQFISDLVVWEKIGELFSSNEKTISYLRRIIVYSNIFNSLFRGILTHNPHILNDIISFLLKYKSAHISLLKHLIERIRELNIDIDDSSNLIQDLVIRYIQEYYYLRSEDSPTDIFDYFVIINNLSTTNDVSRILNTLEELRSSHKFTDKSKLDTIIYDYLYNHK